MHIYIKKKPRSIVISSNGYNLLFQQLPVEYQHTKQGITTPKIAIKQISNEDLLDRSQYTKIDGFKFDGFLGLINVHNSIYIGMISKSRTVGFPRWSLENSVISPSETICEVLQVEFFSLETIIFDMYHMNRNNETNDKFLYEHPCSAVKKLLEDKSFYYSNNYDISTNIQDHGLSHSLEYIINNADSNFIWNHSLIKEIITWRARLSLNEKSLFDNSKIFGFIIRGFAQTILIQDDIYNYSLTLISRISIENGTNSLSNNCISEDGKISNYVETEMITTTERFIFSYTQLSANVPLFLGVTDNQLLYGKKFKLLKDREYTQIAFNKHMDSLESKYGIVSIVNIVKPKSEGQEIIASTLKECAEEKGVKITNLLFSVSTLTKSPHKLLYLLKEDMYEFGAFAYDLTKGIYFGKQTGIIRLSSLGSIEKQIKIEKILSRDIIELATKEIEDFDLTTYFTESHNRLWDQNSYFLSKIYSKNIKNSSKYKKLYSKIFSSDIALHDPLHYYINVYLSHLKSKYTYEKKSAIYCGTFNVSGKLAEIELKEWLHSENSKLNELPDVYIIGLEEVIELTPGHMLSIDPFVKSFWEKKLLSELNKLGREKYTIRWSNQLGGVLLLFYTKETENSKISNLEGDVRKTGFGGITSNKGAVALSFQYSATSFCIIVSHLAAGLENVEQRHNDYKTIFKNVRFSRDRKIKDHDAVIWMGDFNYRILMSNEEVRKLIVKKDFAALFQKDQLNQQMISGESFPYFHEMPIEFPPTYKFDPNTKIYDTSEKMRIPAWTDRILSRGGVLNQLSYGYAEDIIFSDHRPVFAAFQVNLTVEDENKKAQLFNKIYDKLNSKLSQLTDIEKFEYLQNKIMNFEYVSQLKNKALKHNKLNNNANNNINLEHSGLIEMSTNQNSRLSTTYQNRKLPPPSSDAKKWWISTGKQIKISLDVDPENVMLNPKRSPNPFIDSIEPLFVHR